MGISRSTFRQSSRIRKMSMLQKNLSSYFNSPGPSPIVINPDGTTEELKLAKFSSSYLCLVVFQGAFEPLSSTELVNFSKNVFKFRALNCKVVGVVRDSTTAVQEWLAQPFGKELGKNAISCISSPGIGDGDFGLIQALGVPLVKGSPIPSIIISDKKNKIRYFASFSDIIPRSPEETLRVVEATKMIDEAKGLALAPVDWVSPQPAIKNTKAGVLKYYQDRYKKDDKTGLWGSLKRLLGLNSSKKSNSYASRNNCGCVTNGNSCGCGTDGNTCSCGCGATGDSCCKMENAEKPLQNKK